MRNLTGLNALATSWNAARREVAPGEQPISYADLRKIRTSKEYDDTSSRVLVQLIETQGWSDDDAQTIFQGHDDYYTEQLMVILEILNSMRGTNYILGILQQGDQKKRAHGALIPRNGEEPDPGGRPVLWVRTFRLIFSNSYIIFGV